MTRAKIGQPKKPITRIMKIMDGIVRSMFSAACRMSMTMVDSAISIRVCGKLSTKSVMREKNQSTRPPAVPDTMPMMVPRINDTITAKVATTSETVSPEMTREKMSRPVPGSTPIQCCGETPPSGPIGSEPRPPTNSVWLP